MDDVMVKLFDQISANGRVAEDSGPSEGGSSEPNVLAFGMAKTLPNRGSA